MISDCSTLESYITTYGNLLGSQVSQATQPLHVPGRDEPLPIELLRQPYAPQAHVITAGIKCWRRGDKTVNIVAECGTGKTLMGMAMCHGHAAGRPYNAVVFCPPHLVVKWKREIEKTIPDAAAVIVSGYRMMTLCRFRHKPQRPVWWIISNSKAKLSPSWKAVYNEKEGIAHCCACFEAVMKVQGQGEEIVPVPIADLHRRQTKCPECQSPLWAFTNDLDRWPCAKYVQKKLRGVFQYLIVDEIHVAKGEDTAQANAVGALATGIPRVVTMTGTLLGGYADHLRTLLFRLNPATMVADGFEWSDKMAFNERYGRIERRTTEKATISATNRQSKGSQRTVKYVRPGVMPTLFGRHLIGNTIFLSLDEVAENLPPLIEEVISVPMDAEQTRAYREIEEALTTELKSMVARGDKRLLGAFVQTLLAYEDYPFGWGEIGYMKKDPDGGPAEWCSVVTPRNLSAKIRPKEQAIIDQIRSEHREGRKVWVYSNMTDTHDVNERLRSLIAQTGIRVEILRSTVPTTEREEWIAEHAPGADVMVSHPQLVETGLDFFDLPRTYNFPTVMFYD